MKLSRRELFVPKLRTLHKRGYEAQMDKASTFVTNDPLVHLLNRITWGPLPEELAHAREIGYEAYLDEQLDPQMIDDSEMTDRLRSLPILMMDRHTVYQLSDREYRCSKALATGMIERAIHSKRQLYERVVEFWSDHFNIPGDDEYAPELIAFQRDVIRKHALGNFRDLLIETTKSPAMLYYLDNYSNVVEAPQENYARELMELHTMGVDGGYTEKDVKEVARAFTGWTVHNGTKTGFYFDHESHDTGTKEILGHQFPADRGIEDGLHVLSIVAHHPSTANYICRKLCVRFVSDNPPQSLVDSAAALWQQTNGNIRAVLRHIFLSTEFQESVGQKLRRPLDFLIGAMRATGTTVLYPDKLDEMLNDLGQRPFGWHPPNGYPDVAGAWMSTSGMLARWNIAMILTHGAYSDANEMGYGLLTELRERIGQPDTVGELVDEVASQLFGAPLESADRDYFVHYASDGGTSDAKVTYDLMGRKLGSLYGLMLASPQYQWR